MSEATPATEAIDPRYSAAPLRCVSDAWIKCWESAWLYLYDTLTREVPDAMRIPPQDEEGDEILVLVFDLLYRMYEDFDSTNEKIQAAITRRQVKP